MSPSERPKAIGLKKNEVTLRTPHALMFLYIISLVASAKTALFILFTFTCNMEKEKAISKHA